MLIYTIKFLSFIPIEFLKMRIELDFFFSIYLL